MERVETRLERYLKKKEEATSLPVSIVTINFHCDENLAFIIRTAACFGIHDIHVIGSIPSRKTLYNPSGSLVDFVNLYQYSNPSSFIRYSRKNNLSMVSAEITNESTSLYDYQFRFDKETAIVLGNETSGIPVEILLNSEAVHIPMLGTGYCLNTSQTGTAFVSEYTRQFLKRKKR